MCKTKQDLKIYMSLLLERKKREIDAVNAKRFEYMFSISTQGNLRLDTIFLQYLYSHWTWSLRCSILVSICIRNLLNKWVQPYLDKAVIRYFTKTFIITVWPSKFAERATNAVNWLIRFIQKLNLFDDDGIYIPCVISIKLWKETTHFVLICHFLPILEVKSFFEYDMRIYLEIYCDTESRYKIFRIVLSKIMLSMLFD